MEPSSTAPAAGIQRRPQPTPYSDIMTGLKTVKRWLHLGKPPKSKRSKGKEPEFVIALPTPLEKRSHAPTHAGTDPVAKPVPPVQGRRPFWYYRQDTARGDRGATMPVPPNFSRKFSVRTIRGYRETGKDPRTCLESSGQPETQLQLIRPRTNTRRKRGRLPVMSLRIEPEYMPGFQRFLGQEFGRDAALCEYLRHTTKSAVVMEPSMLVQRLAEWKTIHTNRAGRSGAHTMTLSDGIHSKTNDTTRRRDIVAVTQQSRTEDGQIDKETSEHNKNVDANGGTWDPHRQSQDTTRQQTQSRTRRATHKKRARSRDPSREAWAVTHRRMYVFSRVIPGNFKAQSKLLLYGRQPGYRFLRRGEGNGMILT
ncbi:hypothetical protein F4861DRAFT_507760, partial [Xylaria intraflava]